MFNLVFTSKKHFGGNETRAPTSRKYVFEQGLPTQNWSKIFQTFWSHSSVFALEEQPEKLNFQSFFTSKKLFGGNETRAPTSRKYVLEQGLPTPNWSKAFETFLSHSYVFVFEEQPANLDFQSVFTSKRGNYFQWNMCTCFQKIFSWTRYSDAKLMKNISSFLVALFRVALEKQLERLNF